jgi:hypothetical protein
VGRVGRLPRVGRAAVARHCLIQGFLLVFKSQVVQAIPEEFWTCLMPIVPR